MSVDEERKAFEDGYGAAAVEVVQVSLGKQMAAEGKELAYDRWVRLGRDLKRYLGDEEWLPRDE